MPWNTAHYNNLEYKMLLGYVSILETISSSYKLWDQGIECMIVHNCVFINDDGRMNFCNCVLTSSV